MEAESRPVVSGGCGGWGEWGIPGTGVPGFLLRGQKCSGTAQRQRFVHTVNILKAAEMFVHFKMVNVVCKFLLHLKYI